MKKIIIIVVAVLLLVGGSVGATLFFAGVFDKSSEVEDVGGNVEGDGSGSDEKDSKKKKKGEELETFYYNFQPEFVVNFGAKSKPRFLMLEVSAATHDEDVLDLLDKHTPALRNELLILFGSQDSERVRTTEGKNELRVKTQEAIQTVMQEHYGDDVIYDVFFTRFVMQ